jgi:hypothetical protein
MCAPPWLHKVHRACTTLQPDRHDCFQTTHGMSAQDDSCPAPSRAQTLQHVLQMCGAGAVHVCMLAWLPLCAAAVFCALSPLLVVASSSSHRSCHGSPAQRQTTARHARVRSNCAVRSNSAHDLTDPGMSCCCHTHVQMTRCLLLPHQLAAAAAAAAPKPAPVGFVEDGCCLALRTQPYRPRHAMLLPHPWLSDLMPPAATPTCYC